MNHDDKVGHAGWLDDLDELDRHELIEQITVDAYGDEAYWSFHQVIGEHVQFPVRASIAGADVTVTEIDFGAFRPLAAVIALALSLAVAVAARRET